MSVLPPLYPPPEALIGVVASVCVLVLCRIAIKKVRAGQWAGVVRTIQLMSAASICVFLLLAVGTVGGRFFSFYFPVIFASKWAAIIAAFFGVGLFILRKKWLGLYGALEVIGAIVTICICAFIENGSTFQRASALLGATYFLVRGLDNAEKGGVGEFVWPEIRSLLSGNGAKVIVIASFTLSAIGIVVVVNHNSPHEKIAPPYIESYTGKRVKVTPQYCDRIFVICDKKAWDEYRRLKNGA